MDPNTQAITAAGQTDAPQSPVPTVPMTQTQTTATPTPIIPPTTDLTIEEEVAKELGAPATLPQTDKLEDKAKKLSEARKALETKIATLENDVKAKLATLKELKTTIEEEIGKIKELKETEGKIDVEVHKIEELEKKRTEIEQEIKVIEETTTGI